MTYSVLTNLDFVQAILHRMCYYISEIKAIDHDEGKYTGAVFLDLTKPFHTVDHSILCTKLTYYGFQGSSYDLLCNYLAERQQRVLFHDDLSNWGATSIGVPQGSILGPLLFAFKLVLHTDMGILRFFNN